MGLCQDYISDQMFQIRISTKSREPAEEGVQPLCHLDRHRHHVPHLPHSQVIGLPEISIDHDISISKHRKGHLRECVLSVSICIITFPSRFSPTLF